MPNSLRKSFRSRLARFVRRESGAIAVEFAFLAPVFTVALLAGVELTRFAIAHQKMDRVAAASGNLAGQSDGTMSCTDFDNIFKSAENIAKPFQLGSKGVVIISYIEAETATNFRIKWQRRGAGTRTDASKLGTVNALATFPPGFTMVAGDTVVVAEVFSEYDPLVFPAAVASNVVYQTAYDRPRFVNIITTDTPTCP
jgi:Flp pilus assembly protein TadG